MRRPRCILLALLCSTAATTQAAPIVFNAAGANAAGIQPSVESFRSALGSLNPNVAGSFAGGRREINWDGVPDALAAPNSLPANFFNVNSPRGVVFSTPGTGFQVSATAASGVGVEFANLNPSYASTFATFSPQRLFTALGSNLTDVGFFVPGSTTPATTSAFGVVFTDVDRAGGTSLEFFDVGGGSLGTFAAPAISGSETLSFLGVAFNAGERIGRVRITSGNTALGPNETLALDAVAMDDFIYAEPQAVGAVPVGPTLWLTAPMLLLLAARRRSRAAG